MPPPRRPGPKSKTAPSSSRPGPKSKTRAGPKSVKKARGDVVEKSYEVDQIIGIKYETDQNKIQYFVHWKDYPITSASWEDENNVDSEDLLESFERAKDALLERYVEGGYETEAPSKLSMKDQKYYKDHWEVEFIQGVRINPSTGKIEGLVKWKGWSEKWTDWEPENHLTNCKDRLKPFTRAIDHLKNDVRQELSNLLPRFSENSGSDDEEISESEAAMLTETEFNRVEREKKLAAQKTKKPGPKSKTSGGKGRGRPKSKRAATPASDSEEESKTSPNKGRGRPSKRDTTPVSDSEAETKKSNGKARGRPSKRDTTPVSDEEEEAKTSGGKGRSRSSKRGTTPVSDSEEETKKSNGRARGRPSKRATTPASESEEEEARPSPAKKKPGPRSRTKNLH